MTAYLRFRLPQEQNEYDLARLAPAYASAIDQFTRWLRDQRKHRDLEPAARELADEAWEKLHEIRSAEGVEWGA